MRVDPITLEIINNKIAAAADEMCTTLQRASRSTFVKEAADFGVGIVGPDGKGIGYPPSHSIQFLIDSDWGPTLAQVPDIEPGDIVLSNDPYFTAGLSTHLPDLYMAQPYFWKGRLAGFGWCIIHFTDVGGRVPSSLSPSNHEIFQEGLRIPPVKLKSRGRINQDVLDLFLANCRSPEINLGDIKAMWGSLNTGRQRIEAIIERHGLDTFMTAQADLQNYSAAKAREVFRKLPDGAYDFWDYLDDDLVTALPVRVRVRLVVRDGAVHLDLAGSDPAVAAAYNLPTGGRRNWWLTMRLTTFLLSHDRTMALNAGMYRPITVSVPAGTCLHAEFPDAIGLRSVPGRRINDAITGAVLRAANDMISAPSCGAGATIVLVEHGEGGRRHVMVVEPVRGGMGALKGQDGVDARDCTMNNMRNHPVETIEAEGALVIREYDVHVDSGGPGEWRGGVGQLITVEILKDGGIIMIRGMERLRFPAWGVAGGKPGRRFRAILNRGRPGERELTKIDELPVNAGDTVTFLLPGAGGFGDPFRRDPERVRRDVELGFVSRVAAERDYGVMIAVGGGVDGEATRALRAARTKDNLRADFDFGSEREAWETVFDDATISDLSRRLLTLPKARRQPARRAIYETVVPNLPRAGTRPVGEVLTDPDALRRKLREAIERTLGDTARSAAE